jgi:hypothetical protein
VKSPKSTFRNFSDPREVDMALWAEGKRLLRQPPAKFRSAPRVSATAVLAAQFDARGIFLTYTCEDCHDRKMAGYRPDVLTDPAYWTDEPIDDD